MLSSVYICCEKHGELSGPYRKTKIHVGRKIVENITCALCEKCNIYYTTAPAIALGWAEPIDDIPVRKGSISYDSNKKPKETARTSPIVTQKQPTVTHYKHTETRPSAESQTKLNDLRQLRDYIGRESQLKTGNTIRKVYLTPFKLIHCPLCKSPLYSFVIRLPEAISARVATIECRNCNVFYAQTGSDAEPMLRRSPNIELHILEQHQSEMERYKYLKQHKRIESAVFVFLLINGQTAKIYAVTTKFKERDTENYILHYTDIEARKIITAYVYGDQTYTISDVQFKIQLLEDKYINQSAFGIVIPANKICVGKGNGGGYYSVDGSLPLDALLYCVKTACLEVVPVTYDKDNSVYLMDSNVFSKLLAEKGFPICHYVAQKKGSKYGELSEESKLHMLGYNVGDKDGMPERMRQALLADLVEYRFITISEIVSHLKFLIRLNGNRSYKAAGRWAADLEFIENYRIKHDRFALFDRIWKISRIGSHIGKP